MNKAEIAATLRQEIGELEVSVQKLHARCETLKKFVLDLEEEIAGPVARNPKPLDHGTFRKAIDRVFGETKRPRR